MNVIVSQDDIGILLYRSYEWARGRAGDKPVVPQLWNNIAQMLCAEAPCLSRTFVVENTDLLIRRADDYDNIGRFLCKFYRQAKGLPKELWRRETTATREFWAKVAKRFVFTIFFHVAI
jgi:hypothetical protein